jgi:hypothetical protein
MLISVIAASLPLHRRSFPGGGLAEFAQRIALAVSERAPVTGNV